MSSGRLSDRASHWYPSANTSYARNDEGISKPIDMRGAYSKPELTIGYKDANMVL